MAEPADADAQQLAERLLAGDRRALARAITLVENGDSAGWQILRAVYPRTGTTPVVGFTGPPGAGKSTLLAALTGLERAAGRSVALLSVDPSSPITQGALLGDRIRLAEHFLDEGVFIRSMASRGALGGLSEAAFYALLLMDASGRDVLLLETVGVGQAEVDVGTQADTVVLVLMPGAGDSIQALKAGILEIPDVIVLNKSDQPQAEATVRELKAALALGGRREGWQVPVLRTCANSGEGVEQLRATLLAHQRHAAASGALAARRLQRLRAAVVALAALQLRRRFEAAIGADPEVERLLARVAARELDPASAAHALLAALDALTP
jgi:LAO/AO transport system kinase